MERGNRFLTHFLKAFVSAFYLSFYSIAGEFALGLGVLFDFEHTQFVKWIFNVESVLIDLKLMGLHR